ncbi:TonB-dependent receptor [Sphingomonas sp. NFR15]|uniref:TonB-dependent receptor n=1 Tax=Sphingomonas sp. NFR15 TaxID=1566282 RepID=UPI00088EDC7E|nr:TonB-dependent receptor [Sphingomonas sp. NFR15]SDA17154.1 TonB-dependent receptor [Sphingomonas sp. NFR15]
MKRIKGTSLIVLAAALAAPALAEARPVDTSTARPMRFEIGASDLRSAISQFSKATGVQVVVAPNAVNGRHTAGVRGDMTVRQALDALLRGTNLTATIRGGVAVLTPGTGTVTPAAHLTPVATTPAPAAAPAEDDSVPQRDIIVSGYRHSLEAAQDLKRRAVGAEEDILATDIAAFPDLNLAESLQRIPGITITRDSGEGRQIALRGLGADFTRTQLNGMEVLGNTASGMDNRGGVTRSRAFDYSLFASELFNRVAVQKSFSAEQDEGGIAGTVQLSSARPFDYAGTKFVVSAKGQTNDNTSGITPRVVALASTRHGDFGALVSVAYSEIKNNEFGYRNWGWGLTKYGAANIGPNIDAATRQKLLNGVWQATAQSPSSWYTDRKRLGVTSSLQYHPGTNFKLDIDGLYGRLWDHRDDYALATAGTNALTGTSITGGQVIQSAEIDGTNTLRAASFTGIDLRSEHHIVENHTDFYQGVANAEWKVGDRLTLHALGGYEESDFGQPVFDKVFMELKNTPFSFDMKPTIPVNTYGKDITDPNNWALQRLDVQENKITNQYANAKLDGAYKLTDALTFKAGGEFKHFINSGYTWVNKVFHNVPADVAIPNNLKQTVGVDTLTQYIVGNVDGVYGYIGDRRNLDASFLQTGSDYRVDEKTWAGFAQFDLDTLVAGMRLRANAGVRYYSTDLISSGHLSQVIAGVTQFVPVAVGTNSHGFLPAANVALDVAKDVVVRVSASRNVNRPGLGDLAAAGSITTRPNGGSLSLGNPYLKPYKATSVEGSIEWYMDRTGFASLGAFYKKMDSFIVSSTQQIPYGQTGLPLSLLIQGQDANTQFDVSQPINGPGADIKGIEAAFQHDFTFLPGALRHLGVVANGTWFDGHQTVFYSGVPRRLPLYNLSKWAANATLYYENAVWGVRVSDAYRSQYLIGASNAYDNAGDAIKGTNNIDFQAHVNVRKGVRLIAEGINLTNTAIRQFASVDYDRPEVYTTAGRTFTFGVSAEF